MFKAEKRSKTMAELQILPHVLKDDGVFPNNATLPLLVYQHAIELPGRDPAAGFEDLFTAHHWSGSWRNGVYSFHHYHSIAHEVLGVYSGTARVQLGGEQGVVITANPGDVILIPAGVAHKNLGASHDFGIVGAYPVGQRPDMCYGKSGERPEADNRIAQVALPQADPVYGSDGPMSEYWNA
jgi:uncharacterized protein YjlB